ncbi:MAG: DNA gyrase modulator [Cyanobacteria bacterium J06588_4]
MKDQIVEQVIDLAKQKKIEAEVFYATSQDTPIEFGNNRLKSLETKASAGIALRVIADGKLGFASSTDLTRLEELVDAAIATAEIGDPVEFGFSQNVSSIESKSNYQPPDTATLVEIGSDLISKVHKYNPEILVDVSFHSGTSQAKLATTTEVYTEQNSQSLSAVISGNLVRGEDFLQAYAYEVISFCRIAS